MNTDNFEAEDVFVSAATIWEAAIKMGLGVLRYRQQICWT